MGVREGGGAKKTRNSQEICLLLHESEIIDNWKNASIEVSEREELWLVDRALNNNGKEISVQKTGFHCIIITCSLLCLLA